MTQLLITCQEPMDAESIPGKLDVYAKSVGKSAAVIRRLAHGPHGQSHGHGQLGHGHATGHGIGQQQGCQQVLQQDHEQDHDQLEQLEQLQEKQKLAQLYEYLVANPGGIVPHISLEENSDLFVKFKEVSIYS